MTTPPYNMKNTISTPIDFRAHHPKPTAHILSLLEPTFSDIIPQIQTLYTDIMDVITLATNNNTSLLNPKNSIPFLLDITQQEIPNVYTYITEHIDIYHKEPQDIVFLLALFLFFYKRKSPECTGITQIYIEYLKNKHTKKKIELPRSGRLISRFAKDIAQVVKEKNALFYKPQENVVVELRTIKNEKDFDFLGFCQIKPNRFIGLIEQYAITYTTNKDYVDVERSLSQQSASITLESPQFQENINHIERMFQVPIPIMYNNELTFPKRGYDSRFNSWLVPNAPTINPNIDVEQAKKTIKQLFAEFCFETSQDKVNAISAFLTPFIKGLLPSFSTRTPIFFYKANRERAGKDYLAGLTGILYEGQAIQEPAISNGSSVGVNDEELRKKILSSLMAGRKRLHFANNTNHINSTVLEGIATAEVWSDRQLGKNTEVQVKNELMFSLSGNSGITYTPDFANRCRFINLFLDIEDANERNFKNPQLDKYILDNRSLILSSLFALVREWVKGGMCRGITPFASFPQWAEVCGGIMQYHQLGDPCYTDKTTINVGGDVTTQDIKTLFEKMYEYYPNQLIKYHHIKSFLATNDAEGIFAYLDILNSKKDVIKFSNIILKHVGRIFSGIRMEKTNDRISRADFRFVKVDANGYIIEEEKVKQKDNRGLRKKLLDYFSKCKDHEPTEIIMLKIVADQNIEIVEAELTKMCEEGLLYSPKYGHYAKTM
jgi:hypothetical protein